MDVSSDLCREGALNPSGDHVHIAENDGSLFQKDIAVDDTYIPVNGSTNDGVTGYDG